MIVVAPDDVVSAIADTASLELEAPLEAVQVDAARSARAEAMANGAASIGWPRRVGPLKQELGR